MNAQTAHLIVNSIAAASVLVWLAGLRFLLVSARAPRVDAGLDAAEPTTGLPIQGMAEVDGEPESLASRAASILVKGPLRVVGRSADAVVFEGDRASMSFARYVRRGAIHFAPRNQGRTRIEYALDAPQGRALLWGGAIFQTLGLAALVTGFWALNTYVADAPNPAVRVQTVQMIQVCHFLWPPFLFGILYRNRHAALRSIFDTFIRNLPFCEP